MARVELREILTEGDRRAVLGLRRGPGQDAYLDSMEEIFLQAELEARAMPRQWAVHAGDGGRLVGFTMISDNIPEPIDAVVAYLRTRPGADTLFTSCADGPGSPRGFYLGYGFADTGRVMWGENVLALELAD